MINFGPSIGVDIKSFTRQRLVELTCFSRFDLRDVFLSFTPSALLRNFFRTTCTNRC